MSDEQQPKRDLDLESRAKMKAYKKEYWERYYGGNRKTQKRSAAEQEATRRTKAPSRNQVFAEELRQIFTSAKSKAEIVARLKQKELNLYKRGRSVGVQTKAGGRYRLKTLGLSHDYAEALTRLDLIESRHAALHRDPRERARERDRVR